MPRKPLPPAASGPLPWVAEFLHQRAVAERDMLEYKAQRVAARAERLAAALPFALSSGVAAKTRLPVQQAGFLNRTAEHRGVHTRVVLYEVVRDTIDRFELEFSASTVPDAQWSTVAYCLPATLIARLEAVHAPPYRSNAVDRRQQMMHRLYFCVSLYMGTTS